MKNPFTPNFGQVPLCIAGREYVIDELNRAFENGIGDPALTSIMVGARGTGKTVLLSYFAQQAEQLGWVSVDVSCTPGLLEDVIEQTRRKASEFLTPPSKRQLKGVTIGEVGVEWSSAESLSKNWRSIMTDYLEELNGNNIGLVITVDEVNPNLDEMIHLASVYQHFIRENRKVALLMAGLPYKISALLNDESVSFLRRASQYRLGRIEDYEIENAFIKTAESAGKSVEEDALKSATACIEGFPFMMQLVGFRAWEESGNSKTIGVDAMQKGIELAQRDMISRVLRSTLDELSEGDLAYLEAMLTQDGPVSSKQIQQQLQKSPSWVSAYRRRLLEQGVIEERGRAKVAFALPMLRSYLPEYLEAYR